MIAYKAFEKGLKCRGLKYKTDKVNKFKGAKCVREGAHCAENPLDMFTYYPNIETSEYWLVICGGDINEDGNDSKLACTELTLKRELTIPEIAISALIFQREHPDREAWKGSTYVKEGYFKLKKGNNPVLSGSKGEWLGYAVETEAGYEIYAFPVDGEHIKAKVKYNALGQEVKKNASV